MLVIFISVENAVQGCIFFIQAEDHGLAFCDQLVQSWDIAGSEAPVLKIGLLRSAQSRSRGGHKCPVVI